MNLVSTQTQWATGQGFFHTGAISPEWNRESIVLTYAMDCGAVGSQVPVRRELNALATDDSYRLHERRLDVVFLSHFDWDHISGIRQLHTIARPRTYVIPSTSLVERLYLAARTAAHSPAESMPTWYWELLTEPRTWIEGLEGGPDVTEVFGQPEQEEAADRPEAYLPFSELAPESAVPNVLVTPAGRLPSGSYAAAVADSTGTSGSAGRTLWWVLQTYVTPAAHWHLATFEQRLVSTVPAYAKRRKRPDVLRWLVDSHWDELRAAYDASSKVRNLTSLCLYSGPAPTASPRTTFFHAAWGSPSNPVPSIAGPGWLGAGDAALDQDAEADSFVAAFAAVLHHVGTFAVPHHGARSSWNDILLGAFAARSIPAPAAVVGARPGFRGWEHPSLDVVRALGDHGSALRVVTDQEASRWSTVTYLEL